MDVRIFVVGGLLAFVSACGEPTDPDPRDGGTTIRDGGTDRDAGERDAGPPPHDAGPRDGGPTLDDQLGAILATQTTPVVALEAPTPAMPALYELGQALFFDPILSGNFDVACASCHHPNHATSDDLNLAVGTGATGLGVDRGAAGHPPFIPRHSVDLFNRGDAAWKFMFWDGRIAMNDAGVLEGPVPLPAGLSGVLAAQALIPLLDRAEMRGAIGDMTLDNTPNELAAIADDQPSAVWAAIVDRLVAIPEYEMRFLAAFPELGTDQPTIVHVANAIAAFEREAYAATNTPWDDYLLGDIEALNDAQKLGALIFFGSADCGRCHAGALLSDQKFHNTGIPQLGPGRGADAPFDHGRERVSGVPRDRFAFKTAPLRNVLETAPYMHNGVLLDLDAVMRHYAEPEGTVARIDPSTLHPDLAATLQTGATHVAELHSLLSPDLNMAADGRTFVGLSNIRQFLRALTDPSVANLDSVIPTTVPSGRSLP